MLEVYFAKREDSHSTWDLTCTLLPHGGISRLAEDCVVSQVDVPSFKRASEVISDDDFKNLSFRPNPDRWPVHEPKFQIINDGTHPDPSALGNYKIKMGNEIVGELKDIPRGSREQLIKAAIQLIAEREEGQSE